MAVRRSSFRRPTFEVLHSSSSGDDLNSSPRSTTTVVDDFDVVPPSAAVSPKRRRHRRRKKPKGRRDSCGSLVTANGDSTREICGSFVLMNGESRRENSMDKWSNDSSVSPGRRVAPAEAEVIRRLERDMSLDRQGSLDWGKFMEDHHEGPEEVTSDKKSPFSYFMGEVDGGNALRSTISGGNEKKRQRVYNTMFHVPLRCERLIITGFIVCLDSFLSLLTIMPARMLIFSWRLLITRQFKKPDAAAISDFACLIVLALGITTLHLTDISLIYHIIRGQGTFKLYVVYNVLEVFDKLLQSFSEDVLQVLFSSAEGLATCSSDSLPFELLRFLFDQMITITAFIVHAFILLAQAITLSTCIISHNNNLFALLVSNNFAEIKSNVFKKVSKENLQSLVYFDVTERFHITSFIVFVLAQNILEAEGSWFANFALNAVLVFMCEVLIDMLKHSFLAKFNEIKPSAFSDFLEDLCKQILNIPSEGLLRKDLNFIPIAPACVVIRVLAPVYATVLPHGPVYWRWFWIVVWSALTFVILAICKILTSMTLNRFASWYIRQRQERKQKAD